MIKEKAPPPDAAPSPILPLLLAALAREAWWSQAAPAGAADLSSTRFRAGFAAARRHLGDAPAPIDPATAGALAEAGLLLAHRRPRHLLGRIALLLAADPLLPPEQLPPFLDGLFRRGDTAERCAIVCALPLLSCPRALAPVAEQATRGYVRELFEALALNNPYPAAHLPDTVFNQLVLRLLFMDLPLAELVGLEPRISDTLQRMVSDFCDERRVAGRAVPADADLILFRRA